MKFLLLILSTMFFISCSKDAQIASRNLSHKADMFQIDRRIVFYNGITNTYILTIEGKCSVTSSNKTLAVTCKTGIDRFKKHYLGISDNVTYFSEHLEDTQTSFYRYKVLFKPTTIIPDIELKK
jgi:hypothetical protein